MEPETKHKIMNSPKYYIVSSRITHNLQYLQTWNHLLCSLLKRPLQKDFLYKGRLSQATEVVAGAPSPSPQSGGGVNLKLASPLDGDGISLSLLLSKFFQYLKSQALCACFYFNTTLNPNQCFKTSEFKPNSTKTHSKFS